MSNRALLRDFAKDVSRFCGTTYCPWAKEWLQEHYPCTMVMKLLSSINSLWLSLNGRSAILFCVCTVEGRHKRSTQDRRSFFPYLSFSAIFSFPTFSSYRPCPSACPLLKSLPVFDWFWLPLACWRFFVVCKIIHLCFFLANAHTHSTTTCEQYGFFVSELWTRHLRLAASLASKTFLSLSSHDFLVVVAPLSGTFCSSLLSICRYLLSDMLFALPALLSDPGAIRLSAFNSLCLCLKYVRVRDFWCFPFTKEAPWQQYNSDWRRVCLFSCVAVHVCGCLCVWLYVWVQVACGLVLIIVSICRQYHFLPYTVTEMNVVDCVALLSISQYLISAFTFISDAEVYVGKCSRHSHSNLQRTSNNSADLVVSWT